MMRRRLRSLLADSEGGDKEIEKDEKKDEEAKEPLGGQDEAEGGDKERGKG